ncbi:MAG: hypothetical protein KGP35_09410 [Bacteroidetes bacterium]|nr:hypothetical protein [Bacteroidota bacterium]
MVAIRQSGNMDRFSKSDIVALLDENKKSSSKATGILTNIILNSIFNVSLN